MDNRGYGGIGEAELFLEFKVKKMKQDIKKQLEALIKYQWKIQSWNREKTKASVVAYIDARDVMARLDSIEGLSWQDSYKVLRMGEVRGKDGQPQRLVVVEGCIELEIDGKTIKRSDVGVGDGFEAEKSAYSDAFKRAGVKLGIGRFLYDMPVVWLDRREYEQNKYRLSEYMSERGNKPQGKQVTGKPSKSQNKTGDLPVKKEGTYWIFIKGKYRGVSLNHEDKEMVNYVEWIINKSDYEYEIKNWFYKWIMQDRSVELPKKIKK